MKPKRRSKPRKKIPVKKRVTSEAHRPARRRSHVGTMRPIVTSNALPKPNTCEEVEIGDIGGFGSIEELESHENRCTQPATELCNACSKKLCGTHYELLHRDHDSGLKHETSQGLAHM